MDGQPPVDNTNTDMGMGMASTSTDQRVLAGKRVSRCRRNTVDAFSLIELVIVVVIVAIIAAVAIPRLSRGSDGAAEAATSQNVAVVQKALELYAAEHGNYPDPDQVTDQLTLFSDSNGAVSKSRGAPYNFGPYLRKVPTLTTGPNKGSSAIGPKAADGVAWIYDAKTGTVSANLSAGDANPTTQPASSPPDRESDD